MFSVIIPLYNKEHYISKAIHSVLSQTFADLELIIIDDGSTDNSLEVVRAFKDIRIKILEQPNQGVSSARNNAVWEAQYNYIAFLDADDWWDQKILAEMRKLIIECPDAKLFGSSFKIVKHGQERIPNIGLPQNFTKGYIDYIKTYEQTFVTPFNCSFVIVKKDTFQTMGGFNSKLKFGEDFDLWLRIALKHRTAYNNMPLAFSNQDVEANQRALGQEKQWKPSEHYIFNQGYLHEEEKINPDLKLLLDGLRVRSLIRFRINGWFDKEVKEIIKQINFSNQTAYFRRIYTWPISLIKLYFMLKAIGYSLKKQLVNR